MIAGIDLSTKAIDIVAIDEDNPSNCDHLRIPLEPGEWWTSARFMQPILIHEHQLSRWLHNRNVWLIGVERPYGPSRQAIASLHTILGAVLASLPRMIEAFEITPTDMRHELGLPGGCKKGALHLEIAAHTTLTSPDAMDAWAAAYAAMRINERGTPLAA